MDPNTTDSGFRPTRPRLLAWTIQSLTQRVANDDSNHHLTERRLEDCIGDCPNDDQPQAKKNRDEEWPHQGIPPQIETGCGLL